MAGEEPIKSRKIDWVGRATRLFLLAAGVGFGWVMGNAHGVGRVTNEQIEAVRARLKAQEDDGTPAVKTVLPESDTESKPVETAAKVDLNDLRKLSFEVERVANDGKRPGRSGFVADSQWKSAGTCTFLITFRDDTEKQASFDRCYAFKDGELILNDAEPAAYPWCVCTPEELAQRLSRDPYYAPYGPYKVSNVKILGKDSLKADLMSETSAKLYRMKVEHYGNVFIEPVMR